jgi:hypothetical protein
LFDWDVRGCYEEVIVGWVAQFFQAHIHGFTAGCHDARSLFRSDSPGAYAGSPCFYDSSNRHVGADVYCHATTQHNPNDSAADAHFATYGGSANFNRGIYGRDTNGNRCRDCAQIQYCAGHRCDRQHGY